MDQATRPLENNAYTASSFVEINGEVHGPYESSSFPDNDSANTLNEGEYDYNNQFGHSGGRRKGLNIVDANGNRVAPGTTPEGEAVQMEWVNIHDSFNDNRRHSDGCPVVPHGDPEGFFDHFDWSGTYNGHQGTTGNSTGTAILIRGQDATTLKNHLIRRQNPQPQRVQSLPAPRLVR